MLFKLRIVLLASFDLLVLGNNIILPLHRVLVGPFLKKKQSVSYVGISEQFSALNYYRT